MLKIVIAVCVTIVLYVLTLSLVGFYVLLTALQAPSFYQELLASEQPLEVRQQQRDDLEQKALQLQQDLLPDPSAGTAEPENPLPPGAADSPVETWMLELTQDEINSWLTEQQSFELPQQIQQPRIVIEEGQMKIGAKVNHSGLTGYLALSAVPSYHDNQLTIDLLSLKAGAIELGLAEIANSIYLQLPEQTRAACELVIAEESVQVRIPLPPPAPSKPQLTNLTLNPGRLRFEGIKTTNESSVLKRQ